MKCIQCGKMGSKIVTQKDCRIRFDFDIQPIYFCPKHYREIHQVCTGEKKAMHAGKPIKGLPPPYGLCVGYVLEKQKEEEQRKAKYKKGLKHRAVVQKKGKKKRAAQKADLTHVVGMGHWAIMGLGPGIIFGTVGCGPCVGLIVLQTNRSAFCAHIDHHVTPKIASNPDNPKNRTKLRKSLQLFLPPPHHVSKFGVASLRDPKISEFTIDLIKEIYKGKLSKGGDIAGDNIYITGKGEIKSGHYDAVRADGATEEDSDEIHIIETKEGLIVTHDNRETYLTYAIV